MQWHKQPVNTWCHRWSKHQGCREEYDKFISKSAFLWFEWRLIQGLFTELWINLQDHRPTLKVFSVWFICFAFRPPTSGFGIYGGGRQAVPHPWRVIAIHRTNLSCSWYLSRTSSSMIRFGPSPPTKKCNSGYFWQSSGIIPLSKSIPKSRKFRRKLYFISERLMI